MVLRREIIDNLTGGRRDLAADLAPIRPRSGSWSSQVGQLRVSIAGAAPAATLRALEAPTGRSAAIMILLRLASGSRRCQSSGRTSGRPAGNLWLSARAPAPAPVRDVGWEKSIFRNFQTPRAGSRHAPGSNLGRALISRPGANLSHLNIDEVGTQNSIIVWPLSASAQSD